METISVKALLMEIRDLLQTNKAILSIDEFVAYSGIKKSQVYKMTSPKRIPHYKPPGSKKVFFKKKEIQQWLLKSPIKTHEQLKNEISSKLQIQRK